MKYIALALLFFISSPAFAGQKEVMKAACRISSQAGSGSGITYSKDKNYYYILTAGHVVDTNTQYTVEFFDSGEIVLKIPAQREFISFQANTTKDIAVLKCDIRYFQNYQPNIIPVVDKKFIPKAGTKIYGAGCPNGFWMQYWEAKVNGVDGIMGFNMPPVGGQSGSGVCTEIDGKDYVFGLVNWRYEPPMGVKYGGGVLIHNTRRTSVPSIFYPTRINTAVVNVQSNVHTCPLCGLSEEYHDELKDKNGNIIVDKNNRPVLFCRKCRHHHLSYGKHKANGIDPEPCLLYFGIGLGRTRPQQPQQPLPWEQQPFPQQPQPEPDNGIPHINPEPEPEPQPRPEPEPEPNPDIKEEPKVTPVNNDSLLMSGGAFLLGVIGSLLSKKIGKIPSKLAVWWLKSKGVKIIEKVEGKFSGVVEKPAPVEYNPSEQPGIVDLPAPPAPIESQPTNITNNIYVNGSPYLKHIPPYFKEMFDHKAKDGEKIEDWAAFGILYKEAVDMLRQGKLFFNKDGALLAGQEKTADMIDDWVKQQYLARSTREQVMTKNALYQEAMLGFLYKEAISELRKGEFRVLGAEDTANTIDKWVRNEFLRRANITT